MTRFGYHASHEQHPPSRLLAFARQAESAGFAAVLNSDHFHPWLAEQGESGFAWSWMGAALESTALDYGTVSAPGARYHPAILAQAAATLAEMYPTRLWLAAASGEALNEAITGAHWPDKPERNARLLESVEIMRALWAGETVTHRGRVTVQEAKLYTRPARPPLVFGAALSEDTAEWCGGWADGLLTVGGPRDGIERMVAAFHRGGGDGKPVRVQHALCWAPTEAEARREAHAQWRFSALGGEVLPMLRTPAQFAAAASYVTEDDVAEGVKVSSDPARHAEWVRHYVELGVDTVYLFNVGKNQEAYIDTFGAKVLPALR